MKKFHIFIIMINSDRVKLLARTSSYYKNRNKSRLLDRQINLIKSKKNDTDND